MESIKERIERRAYQLFLKRNGAHGYHMEDWVQAEKEIAAEIAAEKKSEKKASAAPAMAAPSASPAEKSKTATGKVVRKPLKKGK
ncbi:MAG: DUF2934 domain-containing protein [Chitinispirillaceae bacterium]|nr:DUF2934 domain-containing protein [Chitinispirillaceae bacterium]